VTANFKARLEEFYAAQCKTLQEQYQRDLPFQDAAFDRWERAAKLGFGEGSNIYNSAFVFGDVRVGKNVWIGPNTILDGSGGTLEIADGCAIGAGTHIYTHDSALNILSGGTMLRLGGNVSIGENCYIACQVVIAPSVSIGSQCLVAANSMVNKDVPALSIVGGTPAARIGSVVIENGEIALTYGKTAP